MLTLGGKGNRKHAEGNPKLGVRYGGQTWMMIDSKTFTRPHHAQVEKLVVANKELVKVYVRHDKVGHDALTATRPPRPTAVCTASGKVL